MWWCVFCPHAPAPHVSGPELCTAAETALSRVQAKDMLTNYRINAMGPILVSKVCCLGIPASCQRLVGGNFSVTLRSCICFLQAFAPPPSQCSKGQWCKQVRQQGCDCDLFKWQ